MAASVLAVLVARKSGGPMGVAKGLSLVRRALRVLITADGRSVGGVEVMAVEMSGMERGVPGNS